MKYFLLTCSLLSACLFATDANPPALNDLMSKEDQKATGVYSLSPKQKRVLATWLANHGCTPLPISAGNANLSNSAPSTPPPSNTTGVLNLNLLGGQYIQLVDGTTYQIHPDDVPISSSWITPTNIEIVPSQDPNYPWKLTNTLTQSSIRAKQVPASSIPAPTPPPMIQPGQPSMPGQPMMPGIQPPTNQPSPSAPALAPTTPGMSK